MSDPTALAERYIAAWNETDEAARRRAVAELWTADGRYVDPLVEVEAPTASRPRSARCSSSSPASSSG